MFGSLFASLFGSHEDKLPHQNYAAPKVLVSPAAVSLSFSMPGYKDGTISVFSEDKMLTIVASKDDSPHVLFAQQLMLPDGVGGKPIVDYVGGVLVITLPRTDDETV